MWDTNTLPIKAHHMESGWGSQGRALSQTLGRIRIRSCRTAEMAEDGREGAAPSSQGGRQRSESGEGSKPVCQYGRSCYRKNPQHFAECDHPWLGRCPMRFSEPLTTSTGPQTKRCHQFPREGNSMIQPAAVAVDTHPSLSHQTHTHPSPYHQRHQTHTHRSHSHHTHSTT